jgi:SsrA-binding protein
VAKKGIDEGLRVVANNRKARHDYFIESTLEAGLVLTGSEIKSIRAGKISLQQAYATIEGNEAWLVGAHVAGYSHAGYADHDPTQRRKLLLHRRQIEQLRVAVQQKGLTIVPLRLYLKDGWAKLELGVARGKKQHDKRQTLREQESRRDMDRAIARARRGDG